MVVIVTMLVATLLCSLLPVNQVKAAGVISDITRDTPGSGNISGRIREERKHHQMNL